VQIKVTGKVQGVYFRKFTQQIALTLEISGYVRNSIDGSVYIEATGMDEKITRLIEWCRKGPSKADVSGLEIIDIKPGRYTGFEIRRTE
jgi:acylphosphatase